MKLENLTFCKKSRRFGHGRILVPSIKVTLVKSGGRDKSMVRIAFHSCIDLYNSNTYCRYAIAGNRLYFMFSCSDDNSYKLSYSSHCRNHKYDERAAKSIGVRRDRELSKFVSEDFYTPKLDNECGLYYIEY